MCLLGKERGGLLVSLGAWGQEHPRREGRAWGFLPGRGERQAVTSDEAWDLPLPAPAWFLSVGIVGEVPWWLQQGVGVPTVLMTGVPLSCQASDLGTATI